jgi:hypothetical protein
VKLAPVVLIYSSMALHFSQRWKASAAVAFAAYTFSAVSATAARAIIVALWTPPQLLPPAARRLLAGVRHLVEAVDCGRLPEHLVVPCVVAKRKTDVVPVPPEEVPEVVRLGAERVVYAFCKAAGVIV